MLKLEFAYYSCAHTHTDKQRAADLSINAYMFVLVHRYVNVCLALYVCILPKSGAQCCGISWASRLRACLAALLTYLCRISINNDSEKGNRSRSWHRHNVAYILHLHAQSHIHYLDTHTQLHAARLEVCSGKWEDLAGGVWSLLT